MICAKCGASKMSVVLETRERRNFTYRKRECTSCGHRYMTYEFYVKEIQTPNASQSHKNAP